jgi:hypothetical protein
LDHWNVRYLGLWFSPESAEPARTQSIANLGFEFSNRPLRMINVLSSFQFVSNANPKSAILRWPAAEMRKFCGLTSLWSLCRWPATNSGSSLSPKWWVPGPHTNCLSTLSYYVGTISPNCCSSVPPLGSIGDMLDVETGH